MKAQKSSKARWYVVLFLSVTFMALACNSWGASGSVAITPPILGEDGFYHATGNFTVSGTYIMEEDDTPVGIGYHEPCVEKWPAQQGRALFSPSYWDTYYLEGTYAAVYMYVDREWSPLMNPVGRVLRWTGTNAGNDLGTVKTFSRTVDISGLEPRRYHTVTVELRDVYSAACFRNSTTTDGFVWVDGEVVATATLNFITPNDIQPTITKLNLGEPKTCPAPLGTKNPINLGTGNKYFQEDDFVFNTVSGNFSFTRSYNSQATFDGPLGYGWTHTYNLKLEVLDGITLRIMKGDGGYTDFKKASADLYRATGDEYTRIYLSDNNYNLHETDGSLYVFDTNGRLVRIEDKHGNVTNLSYESGLLASVEESVSGRALTFNYTAGKLTSITGPATTQNPSGLLLTLEYTDDNLTRATYADGESYQYFYEDPNDPHNLTKRTKSDGSTVLNEVQYDDQDRAIRSSLNGGNEAVDVTYGHWQATVTDSLGRTKTYAYDVIDGIAVAAEIKGDGCSVCGEAYEYGSSTAIAERQFQDDFTGADGSSPDPAKWATVAGSPEIQSNKLWLDASSSNQVVELINEGKGDFDIQMDFEVDTGPGANSWSFFIQALSGSNEISVRYGFTGSRYTYWFPGGSASGSATNSGKLRLTRTGNLFTAYRWMYEMWIPMGSGRTFLEPFDALSIRLGLDRWGNNPAVKGYIDNVEVVSGELAPPKAFNLLSKTDRNGVTTTYGDYDINGNAQSITKAVGSADERVTTYSYHPDLKGRPLTIIEESVLSPGEYRVRTFDYDSDGNGVANENPTKIIYRTVDTGYTKDGSGATAQYAHETKYTYNPRGQLASVDGPRSGSSDAVSYTYYANGDLQSITHPLIGTASFDQYDALGNVGRIIDENGNETTFTYDLRGRLASITTAAGTTTISRTDLGSAGRSETTTLVNGTSASYTYNPAGYLVEISDSLNNRIIYGYDTEGNRVSEDVKDTSGTLRKSLQYQYDQFDRVFKVLYPDGGNYDEFGYDNVGNRTSSRDALGRLTSYVYDNLKRLTQAIQPGNVTTNYTYDRADNLTSVTDAESHTTTYTYDDAGSLLETVSPDTGTTRYGYDEAGNLISKTDANGVPVTYIYDSLNRLTKIDYPSEPDVTYTYDQGTNGKGRLTGMTDGSGACVYTYDALGNLIREEKTIDSITYTTEYNYDAAGLLTGIIYPDGRVVTYELDGAERVIRVTTTKDAETRTLAENISYAPFGPLTDLIYGNGIVLSQSYDQRYQLTGIKAGTILDLTYVHDGAGNITTITNNLDAGRTQSFSYDDLDRLGGATGIYGAVGYTYDKVGNRLSRTVNGQAENYSYVDGTSRLSEVTKNGTTAQSYSHDANGAITGIGERSFIYGQNNRLIQAMENGSLMGEYTYNGAGQRVIKRASEDTIIYHYDKDGNLISESMSDGTIVASYVYLGTTRLARIGISQEQQFTVSVETSKGKTPSGLKVYAFSEAGSYTGKQAVTDETGAAQFQPEDFAEGTYTFRVDYLGGQFWSEPISMPDTSSVSVLIEEETVEVEVTSGSGAAEGVKVYLFAENGTYRGIYGVTDETGMVSFDLPVGETYKFRADLLGNQYWSDARTISSGGTIAVPVETGGGLLQVTVEKDPETPMVGVKVYLFTQSGSYLGLSQVADLSGTAGFDVSEDTYKVRADYLGYQFWSLDTLVTENTSIDLSIAHQEVTITVSGMFQGTAEPLEGIDVYLFTPTDSYLGEYETTNGDGQAIFDLPERAYKVRADYLGGQFWSEEFTWQDTAVELPMAEAQITVTGNNLPLEGVEVYVFSGDGSYLGVHEASDVDGKVTFRLPAAAYMFRADYQGSQFWSGVKTLAADMTNPVTIATGGGSFTLRVLKSTDAPLVGVNCYVFNEGGSYLGNSGITNSEGEVSFELANGTYQFRVDYLGHNFWSDLIEVPAYLDYAVSIAHQYIPVTIEGVFSGDVQPMVDIPVYLFSPSGVYLGLSESTDGWGQVVFDLPKVPFKVRADYLGQQFWSEEFTGEDTTVTIPEGIARVHVSMAGQDIEGVPVHVYSASDSYLGVNGTTDASGIVEFRLPAAAYKFRADHQGEQFSASAGILEDTVIYVEVDAGGGEFVLTVDDGTALLANTKVYVFSSGGSYLGIWGTTDQNGQISFDLSDGSYKFRVDHLGYQFWTPIYDLPQTLSGGFTIQHQQVVNTVEGMYLSAEPLEGLKVYLYTSAGSYLGQYKVTDTNGQVSFSLPDREYKVRVDYLGDQYWSDSFQWLDTTVTINQGLAGIHVHRTGVDVEGVRVYLFTAAGSYLGKYETTNVYGEAEFLLPDGSYKFRVDEGGNQYWSDVINIIPWEENPVELDLDLLALQWTNDPYPEVFHGTPPAYKPEVKLASLSMIQGLLTNVVVSSIPQARITYYLNDHLGTSQKMTDENGQVVWSGDYMPFGNASITTADIENSFRFPGQYFDSETGLHYSYHRYYDPRTGRYLTPDPIGQAGGINLFVYTENNPVNNTDPTGEFFAPAIPILVYVVLPAAIIATAWWASQQTHNILKSRSWRDDVDLDNWPFAKELYGPSAPNPEQEKRRRVEDECHNECEGKLGGDPCGQGFEYTNCMKDCMARYGFRYP